jgi:3-ketosteroid 9alpha-monooxygenase subunit A
MTPEERFPQPIPYGWYFVGYCDELAIGEVKPLHYFGRDLVLFRDEDGRVGMLDAYCPHLGAHLGHGGTVKGKLLHCPFHGWGFDADGWCKDIAYATTLPQICKREPVIGKYHLEEANGVIWAWYHPHDIAPMFDVQHYPEFTDPAWSSHTRYGMWRIESNCQEQAENAVDTAHFRFIHGTPSVPEGFGEYEGHIRRTGSDGVNTVTLPDGTQRTIKTAVRTWANGAGQKNTMLQGLTTVWLMVLYTPIEQDCGELRFAFTYPPAAPGSVEELAFKDACERIAGETGVLADLPIWNNKIHRSRPILCDGDGPILQYRKWFQQFYDFDAPQAAAAAAE